MIVVLSGIPSSGKSTRAKALLKESEKKGNKCVILSRDILRQEYNPSRVGKFIGSYHFEEKITQIYNQRLCKYLSLNYDIILDNMNIRPRYIRETLDYISHYNRLKETKLEFSPFTDDVNTCLHLNEERAQEDSVPESAIRKCYETYKSNRKELQLIQSLLEDGTYSAMKVGLEIPTFNSFEITPYTSEEGIGQEKAFLFDVDGTLAEHHRDPYNYKLGKTDTVIEPVRKVLDALSKNYKIVILSGRPEKDKEGNDIRTLTEDWLKSNNIYYDNLFMRSADDTRNDAEVKYELFNNNVRGTYDVQGVFDDRLRVVRMWEELGIHVFNVNNGIGEF